MAKILISGASGYIGSALIQYLLQLNRHHIGALTRSLPDYLSAKPGLEIYRADLTEPLEIELEQEYDVFIHLAAANDVDSQRPKIAIDVNVTGTRHCLDFCLNHRIRRFVMVSTFQALGPVSGSLSEASLPKPQNDYGITHRFAEEYVALYQDRGIETLTLRPTNIFGAPISRGVDRWTLVPAAFCLEIAQTGRIRLMSSGRQRRDFISLPELVRVLARAAEDFSDLGGKLVHVSSGRQYSIFEIAETVLSEFERLTGKLGQIEIASDQPAQANVFTIDRSLISAWQDCFDVDETLTDEIRKTFQLLGPELATA
ncbi:MAG: hypothetical protein CVV27_13640 [Candidatus Melainabacteria bacterium HGW-Melainabacteria-1]|nr:MAG: hypothetical protein CVV27_13640 [Candidatus Melainabacteria bacterium HGW-Melainabacteria-1]